VKFFNPKLSAITFDISLVKETIQLKIAKTLNPNASVKDARNGVKLFDWDNAVFFSLSPEECAAIVLKWKQISEGSYVNPKATDDKYKNIYTVTHFKENIPNHMRLFKSDRDGRLGISIAQTSYIFTSEQSYLFYNLLKFGCEQLPSEALLIQSMKRYETFTNNKNKDGNKNNSGGYKSNLNKNTHNSNSETGPPSFMGDDIPF
jgi:hypothetical protein